MSSLIDLYNLKNDKFEKQKVVGEGNFFKTLEEIKQFNISQRRFLTNVDYSDPKNFAKFGSSQEYYKSAINYIDSEYPYDGSTEEKLSWENSLSDIEYFLFTKELPKSVGYLDISGSQYVKILSHVKDPKNLSKESFDEGSKYTSNTTFSIEKGFTFESWVKFEDTGGNSSIFTISALTASGGTLTPRTIFSFIRNSTNNLAVKDVNLNSFAFQTSIPNSEWHHLALTINQNSASLFIDGNIKEETNISSFNWDTLEFTFTKIGLFIDNINNINLSYDPQPQTVFKLGPCYNQKLSFDETRLWNQKRSVDDIGRYWFTNVDGNNFSVLDIYDLLFYYKYNEGWDADKSFLCVDYSGRKNDSYIFSYSNNNKINLSGLDLSGLVQDKEKKDIHIGGLKYSQDTKDFYEIKINLGKDYDETNMHMLYNKFPSWMLEEEEEQETKHLFQLVQIISYYFDDLFLKIKEITEFKKLKYEENIDRIYPFYDKILTSMGFDVSELFNNLTNIEKISSRNDTTLFDADISKIKNAIFQNIYNNLAYIYKSKGTEKSLKALLRAYGVSDKLIRINLYADGADYYIQDRSKQTTVTKKTVSLSGQNSIYLKNPYVDKEEIYNFSYETSVIFQKSQEVLAPETSSIFGFQATYGSSTHQWLPNTKHCFVLLEKNNQLGYRFLLSGSDGSSYSDYYKNLYDDSAWNFCVRKKHDADNLTGSVISSLNYSMELYGVNNSRYPVAEFSCSIPYDPKISGIYEPRYLRTYVGARKENLDDSVDYYTNLKLLYCNFWTDYLTNNEIISHNKDILNYGVN